MSIHSDSCPSQNSFFYGQEDLRKGIDTEGGVLKLAARGAALPGNVLSFVLCPACALGRDMGFTCGVPSAQPFRGSGTRVIALTGVPPLDRSLSHSFKCGPYEGSERDSPGLGGKNWRRARFWLFIQLVALRISGWIESLSPSCYF
jgi:hypothetical protein